MIQAVGLAGVVGTVSFLPPVSLAASSIPLLIFVVVAVIAALVPSA